MSASSRSACPGAASPRGEYGHEAQDAQGQVYEVVPHGVAVLKQPQHVGHDEAEQAHQRVNHAHDQHHGAGNPLVSLAEAHIGKQAAGDQVDYVLDDVCSPGPATTHRRATAPTLRARGALPPRPGRMFLLASVFLFLDKVHCHYDC